MSRAGRVPDGLASASSVSDVVLLPAPFPSSDRARDREGRDGPDRQSGGRWLSESLIDYRLLRGCDVRVQFDSRSLMKQWPMLLCSSSGSQA